MTTPSRLVLGTAQLGLPYGITGNGQLKDDGQVREILQHCLKLGITEVDTAPSYGVAESRLGEFFASHDDQMCVCTKLERLPKGLDADQVARAVATEVRGSLERLRIDSIGCLLVHHVADVFEYGAPLVGALETCLASGLVRALGVSVYERAELDRVLPHTSLASVQYPFNVFNRSFHDADVTWPANGRRFMRSVLLQGVLGTSGEHLPVGVRHLAPSVAAWSSLANEHGVSPAELAVRYAAASGVDMVVGVDGTEQLDAVAGWVARPLEAEMVRNIEARTAIPPLADTDPRRWS